MMTESEFKKLPKSQREAIQQRLKDQGLYSGNIDGSWGAGTETAIKQEEQRRIQDEERARAAKVQERASEAAATKSEAEAKAIEAEAAEAARKTKAREERSAEAGSPTGIATQIGANVVAPAAGAAAGMGMGKLTNAMLDLAQESRNRVLQGVARDRIAGLTTRDAAQQAAKQAGAVPMGSPVARTAARMAPHVGLGLLSIGKGAQTLQQQDPDAPFYADMANRAAGLGYIGAGAGLMKQGMRYGAAPGVAPDAQALAVINSPQLRRGAQSSALADALTKGQIVDAEVIPDAPKAALPAPEAAAETPKAPAPGTKAYMVTQAKEFGIKGTSRMTKSQLADALSQAMSEHGGKRIVGKKLPKITSSAAIPLAVGSYLAATGDSEAADASLGERASNAAGNFAVGAGAAYGGSKLADALARIAPSAMSALGAGANMAAPGAMVDLTDEFASPEARNWAARNFPEALQLGAVGEAREMATTPPQNPERRSMGPRIEDPALQNRIRRMSATGASPDQIAAFLNQAFQ